MTLRLNNYHGGHQIINSVKKNTSNMIRSNKTTNMDQSWHYAIIRINSSLTTNVSNSIETITIRCDACKMNSIAPFMWSIVQIKFIVPLNWFLMKPPYYQLKLKMLPEQRQTTYLLTIVWKITYHHAVINSDICYLMAIRPSIHLEIFNDINQI